MPEDTKQAETPELDNSKETLKADVIKTKAQLNNIASLVNNCNKIKSAKRLLLSEDTTQKQEGEPFSFVLTGDIVVKIMQVVDIFIDEMKIKALTQQDKLIGELGKYLNDSPK